MGSILLFTFIAVPIIEIGLFIKVGGYFGFWPTIGIVILTAIIGTTLLRQQGLATLKSAQASLEQNGFPLKEVFDGLCLLLAGALLLTPGFFTDTIGLMMFVPPLRALLAQRAAHYMAEHGHIKVHGEGLSGENRGWQQDETVIDVEFSDITPDDEEAEGGASKSNDKRLPPRTPD